MKGWKKYAQNEILTSNPGKVTIMAYERCLLNLKTAKGFIEEMKFKEAEKKLIHTSQIINELLMQLNKTAYPDLVEDLEKWYVEILDEIDIIIAKRQLGNMDSIIIVLQNLLDGYREAIKRSE